MAKSFTLYLHFPCFDGVICGVLASEYLHRKRGWEPGAIVPVNYSSKGFWPTQELHQPAVVVDFLYHPQAVFWVDHHQTSFVNKQLQADFESRKSSDLIYDAKSPSCAELLWRKTYRSLKEPRFREMVDWARRIDSARYESVEEAVLGDAPALRINASFLQDQSPEYCQFLVTSLREQSLANVADSTIVLERYRPVKTAIARGQRLFARTSRLEDDGIVVFSVPEEMEKTLISRYAPYLAFPKARYSVGILPAGSGAKITAMRNPWRRFKSLPLGRIFSRYGGGGHQRVASVLVKKGKEADSTLQAILRDLRNPDLSLLRDSPEELAGD
jgi:hypothetical protein